MTKLWLLLPNSPLGNQVIWLELLHQWWVARRNRNCLGSQWGFPLPPGNAEKPLISGSSSVQILTMHSITHVIIPCNHTPQQGPFFLSTSGVAQFRPFRHTTYFKVVAGVSLRSRHCCHYSHELEVENKILTMYCWVQNTKSAGILLLQQLHHSPGRVHFLFPENRG